MCIYIYNQIGFRLDRVPLHFNVAHSECIFYTKPNPTIEKTNQCPNHLQGGSGLSCLIYTLIYKPGVLCKYLVIQKYYRKEDPVHKNFFPKIVLKLLLFLNFFTSKIIIIIIIIIIFLHLFH